MLRLNALQAVQFVVERRAALEQELYRYLQASWSDVVRARGESDTRQFITQAIDVALLAGVKQKGSISRYVNATFALEEDFGVTAQAHWISAIMARAGESGEQRVERLCECVRRLYRLADDQACVLMERALLQGSTLQERS